MGEDWNPTIYKPVVSITTDGTGPTGLDPGAVSIVVAARDAAIAAKDAQIAALKEALEQFAVICAYYEGDRDNPPDDSREVLVEMKYLRRARSTYEGKT